MQGKSIIFATSFIKLITAFILLTSMLIKLMTAFIKLLTAKTKLKVSNNGYSEYQIIAIDKNKVPSFASEPIIVYDKRNEKTIELEEKLANSEKIKETLKEWLK